MIVRGSVLHACWHPLYTLYFKCDRQRTKSRHLRRSLQCWVMHYKQRTPALQVGFPGKTFGQTATTTDVAQAETATDC
jgi:hypothetical protein